MADFVDLPLVSRATAKPGRGTKQILVTVGSLMVFAAMLHLATIFGGVDWYAFLGAPAGLIEMERAGSLRPAISCLLIGSVLLASATYAYSGAGLIRKLPALRFILALIGIGLMARAIVLPTLLIWQPHLLSGICSKCQEINFFVVFTSIACLLVGLGYVTGACRIQSMHHDQTLL